MKLQIIFTLFLFSVTLKIINCDSVAFQNIGTYVGKDNSGISYKKSFYLPLHFSKHAWFEAAITCMSFNMTLASFKTAQEFQSVQTFLFNNWNLITAEWVFIGGMANTPMSPTDWYWVDTSTCVSFEMKWCDEYNPDFGWGTEWCLSLGWKNASNMLFNDLNCYWKETFLCQKVY